jgi:hypothetical protein
MHMSREHLEYGAQEIAAITQYFKKVETYRNAMVWGQACLEIKKRFGKVNFPALEKILRKMGSSTYIVAVPVKEKFPEFNCIDLMTQAQTPFLVWFCVNGEQEALEVCQREHVAPKDNIENLKSAGFLVPKEGTDLSKKSNAGLN